VSVNRWFRSLVGNRRDRPAEAAPSARDVILTLLAVAAGCVDAVSFLGLGQVLTAAMTGNTVLLGLALGQADAQAALRSTAALLGFFAGSLLGAAIVDRGAEPIWSPAVAATLVIELLLLVALAIAWQLADGHPWINDRFALIATAGIAMGLQSAVAHRAGVAGIATTYVTGTLTTLATGLIGSLRERSPREAGVEETMPIWFPAIAWLAYGLGAVLAGATYRWWAPLVQDLAGDMRWSSAALAVPIAIVAMVALTVVGKWRGRSATA
jgi:uncharacterized membrane protein YoaK (UPF0700 family)